MLVLLASATTQATPWTPTSLPSWQLKNWYDASDATTLWQNTGATSPVTATGQTVLRINDKSVNGNHLTTNGGGPVYTTGVMNSLPVVRFNGDMMANLAATMGSASDNFTVIGVFKVASNTSWDNWLDWGPAAGYSGLVFVTSGTRPGGPAQAMEFAYGGGTGETTDVAVTGQSAFLFVGAANQAISPSLDTVWMNGTSQGARNSEIYTAQTGPVTHINIGIPGQVPHGDIAELIVMNTGAGTLSDANRQLIEGYLAHKWWGAGANNLLPANHPYKNSAPVASPTYPTQNWAANVNSNWDSSTANWSGAVWGAGNNAVFGATGVGTVNLGTGITANSLTFNTAGYTIAGGALGMTGSAAITSNADATISSMITGSQNLALFGSATLTLAGSNTYGGAITVNQGTLAIGGSPGAASLSVASGAALTVAGAGTAGQLTLAGTLALGAGSSLNLDMGSTGASDRIQLTGGYVAPVGVVNVNVNALAGFGAGTYPVITGAAGISASNFVINSKPSGYECALFVSNGTLTLRCIQHPPLRILPLGDDITLGKGGTANLGGYRSPLYSALAAAGYNVNFIGTLTTNSSLMAQPHHEGQSGVTTTIDVISANLAAWLAAVDNPDVVLLYIGLNDLPGGDFANAINRLDSLITQIATLRPNAHIIVSNLMDRSGTVNQANIQTQFNAYVPDKVNAQAALGRRVTFLDMHSVVSLSYMPDGRNPNQAGYNLMANAWSSAIQAVCGPLGDSGPPNTLVPQTWDGVGGNTWDVGGTTNWTGTYWTNGEDAIFNAAGVGTIQVGRGVQAHSLTFNHAGYTLAGTSLLLDHPTVTANADATISAPIAAYSGLVKEGAGTLNLNGFSSYVGNTTVTGGVLDVTGQLYHSGGSSAVVTVGTAATLRVYGLNTTGTTESLGTLGGSATNLVLDGGTLEYAGAGRTWGYRPFTIGASGATLKASQTAGVWYEIDNLTNPTSLTLDGTAVGEISVGISGPGALVKNGSGLWALDALNSYTGATTINAGILRINGLSASLAAASTVTVGVAGTLAGNGTIHGDTVVHGTVAPGAAVGVLNVNTVELAAGSTFEVEFSNWEGIAGGSWDEIYAEGAITLSATPSNKLTIRLLPAGLTFVPETSKTFLIATGGSDVVGFDASAIAVDASAMPGTGTWAVQINPVYTSDLELVYTAGVQSPYQAWTTSFTGFTDIDPSHDPDGDGLTNQQEFAFGLDPTSGSSNNPIAVPFDKTHGTFSYTRPLPATSGLSYVVYTSPDLKSWTVDGGATQTVTGTNYDVETVQVTLSGGKPLTAAKLFVRVAAQ
jgi:autotransporter-associated beta strand protein